MTFTAELTGTMTMGSPAYDWTLSAGRVSSGQGTASITVDTTGLPPNSNVTATVNVKGLSLACRIVESETGSISPAIGCGMPVDEYGRMPWNNERARLDNIWMMLRENPEYGLFVHLRLDPDEALDPARKHARKMIEYILWRDKKFDASRVTFVIYPSDRHSTIFDVSLKDAKQRLCDTGCIEINGAELIKK